MSKEVAVRGTGTAVALPSENPFAQAASDMGEGPDGAIFSKFSGRTGDFTAGSDNDVLFDEDMQNDGETCEMAVDMMEASRGWMCWINGEVEEELMVRVVDGHPLKEADLPDHEAKYDYDDDGKTEDGWVECISLPMRSITTGTEYKFKGSSSGMMKAFKKLLKAYGSQFSRHDLEEEVAIISFGIESYQHKKKSWGKIYNPLLNLVRWMDIKDIEESLSGDDYEPEEEEAPEPEVKPKARRKAAPKAEPAPEPEPEVEEEAEPEQEAKPAGGRRPRRKY